MSDCPICNDEFDCPGEHKLIDIITPERWTYEDIVDVEQAIAKARYIIVLEEAVKACAAIQQLHIERARRFDVGSVGERVALAHSRGAEECCIEIKKLKIKSQA